MARTSVPAATAASYEDLMVARSVPQFLDSSRR